MTAGVPGRVPAAEPARDTPKKREEKLALTNVLDELTLGASVCGVLCLFLALSLSLSLSLYSQKPTFMSEIKSISLVHSVCTSKTRAMTLLSVVSHLFVYLFCLFCLLPLPLYCSLALMKGNQRRRVQK